MKAFFSRSSRGSASNDDNPLANYKVPPFPNPLPERRLTLHSTPEALVILPRPSMATQHRKASKDDSTDNATASALPTSPAKKLGTSAAPGAKILWGRDTPITAIVPADVKAALASQDKELELVCYGIVGRLTLFRNSYLLVITSRELVGHFFHPSWPMYRCTGVLAIPLDATAAATVLKGEIARQNAKAEDSSSTEEEDESEQDDVRTPAFTPRSSYFRQAPTEPTSPQHRPSPLATSTVRPTKSGPWLLRKDRAASEGGQGAPDEAVAPEERHEAEGKDVEGSNEQEVELPAEPAADAAAAAAADLEGEVSGDAPAPAKDAWHEASKAELEEKVVKETARQYGRGEMWFAYDFDLTTPLQRKHAALKSGSGSAPSQPASSITSGASLATSTPGRGLEALPIDEPFMTIPLWRRVDRRFWHNENMSRDFVEAGLHALILPIMQGYVQVTSLPMDSSGLDSSASSLIGGDAMDAVSAAAQSDDRVDAQLLIISRRSKERAGLRFQRRGINEFGQVANYVETEQVLCIKRGGQTHLLSFIQFRGSIPMYWSQSPFNLKPPPVLERSLTDNRLACSKHFDEQVKRYEKVTCINLAEQHGKEGQITEAYKSRVADLNSESVQYVAFDFHRECAGMKFENVSRLLDQMVDTLSEMDFFHQQAVAPNARPQVLSLQKGAFRVSCLDCLDRTNVVQSAFARQALLKQLARVEVEVPHSAVNLDARDEAFEFVFNDSWANNGDMISQIYAGTRALKGDFTRTGKRNLMGMMNDATASVYRMVQGAVLDFFRQTVMDFHYGSTTLTALQRYNDNLAAQDPAEGHRLARVRAAAIDSCASIVLGEGEEKMAGWTLFAPIEANTIQSPKLEEKVVLLTSKAVYSCGYDFTSEKLVEFSRILLGDITSIKKGVYIISPSEGYHPEEHWGFIFNYLNSESRLNNASMRNVPPPTETKENFLAFRAVRDDFAGTTTTQPTGASGGASAGSIATFSPFLRGRSSTAGSTDDDEADFSGLNSHEMVDRITQLLRAACQDVGACDEDDEDFVKDEAIQTLAQAKAHAPLFGPLIEGLKRRLWL